jgi:multidrug resistance efflux pump
VSAAPRIRTPWRQRLADLTRATLSLTIWLAAATTALWLLGRRSDRTEIVGLARSVEYTLSSPSAARVARLEVDLLQEVEAGQALVLLDPEPVEARLATLRGVVAAMAAESERARAELAAGRQDIELGLAADARRFANDQEDLRLDVLELEVELASDRVRAQRLELRTERLTPLASEGVLATGELDEARLELQEVRVRIEASERRLEGLQAALEGARRRQAEFHGLNDVRPSEAALLTSFSERVRVEELRLAEIEVERDALVLRAPAAGTVQRLEASPGQALAPGQPLLVLVARESPEVIAYLPESQVAEVHPGQRVLLAPPVPLRDAAELVVVRVGPAVEALPARLWSDPSRPQFGVPVLARGPGTVRLRPGERVTLVLEN